MARVPAAEHLRLSEEDGGICVPFERNANDKETLFAGSIYAGAVFAAYRAAERRCASEGLMGGIVAKGASIRYLKPIRTDGHAVATACTPPQRKPNGNHTLSVSIAVLDAAKDPCAEVVVELILLKDRQAPET